MTAYVSSFIQIMIPCIGSLLIRYGIGSVKGITGKDSLRMLGFVIFVSILSYHLVYTVSAIWRSLQEAVDRNFDDPYSCKHGEHLLYL